MLAHLIEDPEQQLLAFLELQGLCVVLCGCGRVNAQGLHLGLGKLQPFGALAACLSFRLASQVGGFSLGLRQDLLGLLRGLGHNGTGQCLDRILFGTHSFTPMVWRKTSLSEALSGDGPPGPGISTTSGTVLRAMSRSTR